MTNHNRDLTWDQFVQEGGLRDLGALLALILIAVAHFHGVHLHWIAPLR